MTKNLSKPVLDVYDNVIMDGLVPLTYKQAIIIALQVGQSGSAEVSRYNRKLAKRVKKSEESIELLPGEIDTICNLAAKHIIEPAAGAVIEYLESNED